MKRTSEERGQAAREWGPNRLTGTGLGDHPPVAALVAGSVVVLAAAAVMAWWTWGAWPDVLVDFGQQLYLPWQIAEGHVLYADLAYYNGPLSQYLNALAFKLFGVGLQTIVVLNLFWMGLLIALLYHAFTMVAGRLSALTACLLFVLLFGFGQYVGIGNYNYVCPYSHEMTHGLMLSLASMVCIWHSIHRGFWRAGAAGLLLGLAFLTKAEVFTAGAAGTGIVLLLTFSVRFSERPGFLRKGAWFLLGFLVPPILAFLLLCRGMPEGQALAGTLGSWVAVVNHDLTNLPFFRQGMGLADIRGSLILMAAWAGAYAAMILGIALVSLAARGSALRETLCTACILAVLVGGLWAFWGRITWTHAARGFFPALLFIGVILTVRLFRVRGNTEREDRLIRQISMIVFASAMLGKMALNARIYHYGFVLAMPATLVLAVALVDWIPSALEHRGGAAVTFRAGAWVLLGSLVFAYLGMQGRILDGKEQWVVGPAGDRLRADAIRGGIVKKALEVFPGRIHEGQTLAALPEGVMLNFLLRRRNPTPYTNFMPTEMILFGEARIREAFRARPPDWICLVHKDTSEFGFRFFGQDYGQALSSWIMGAYDPVGVVGALPLRSNRYGILLMARKKRQDG